MKFLSPQMLWTLTAIPLLAGAYVLLQRRRKRYVVRFTNLDLLAQVSPRSPGWRRHLSPALLLCALAVLAAALARPAVAANVPREQSSIVLVIDVSRSMAATDLAPDRITAAKQAADTFVDSMPKKLRVAVVAFSNSAELVSPLGTDRAATKIAIDSLSPIAGTAIRDGLAAALQEIANQRVGGKTVPAAVLLLSDGVSNHGRASQDVALDAKNMNVPVYTVGIGTANATLQLGGGQVPVGLDEQELKTIAETTGGQYFQTADAGALRAVYKDLGSKLGYVKETREATAAAAGIAALFMLAAAGIGLLWTQRIP